MQLNFATYQSGYTVTPSDTANNTGRAFYVGAAGDVTVVSVSGATVLFKAVPVGGLIPIEFNQVKSTGTTSTSITALQ